MIKIGIAGGIGSGKSYVCQRLQQRGYEVYDCDSAAKRLIRTSPEIREQLTRLVGPDAYNDEGQLNKAVISRFLLASADNQKAINDIVHPAVFRDFEESGMEWMEIIRCPPSAGRFPVVIRRALLKGFRRLSSHTVGESIR